jgi:hypothetical protein
MLPPGESHAARMAAVLIEAENVSMNLSMPGITWMPE